MSGSSFKEFILDQLNDLDEVNCRAMFGGYGIYSNGVFFGIIFKNRLYFKTTAATRRDYTAQKMKPFRPNARQTLKTYYEVPAEVLEDRDLLRTWAQAAIRSKEHLK